MTLRAFLKFFCIGLLLLLGLAQLLAAKGGGEPEEHWIESPLPVSKYNTNYREPLQTTPLAAVMVDGVSRSYFYHAPATKAAKQPRPIIVLLHGAGRKGASLIDKWKRLADRENVLLIAPNAAKPGAWTGDDSFEMIQIMVYDLHLKHPVASRRIYVFGHSAGAIHALMLAVEHPEYFAAASVHAGAMGIHPLWARLKMFQAARPVPVSLFVGEHDPIFDMDNVRYSAEILAAGGFPVQFFPIRGHNHWYYDIAPFINDLAWKTLGHYALGQ